MKISIGKAVRIGDAKLFGGTIQDYVDTTGEQIPMVIRSTIQVCPTQPIDLGPPAIQVINLHGMHHQTSPIQVNLHMMHHHSLFAPQPKIPHSRPGH